MKLVGVAAARACPSGVARERRAVLAGWVLEVAAGEALAAQEEMSTGGLPIAAGRELAALDTFDTFSHAPSRPITAAAAGFRSRV